MCDVSTRHRAKFCVTCITRPSLGWLYTERLNGVRSTVHLLTFHIKAPHYTLKIIQPMCNYCRHWRKVTQRARIFFFLLGERGCRMKDIWISSRRATHRDAPRTSAPHPQPPPPEWQPCDVQQHIGPRSDERAAVRGETSAALPPPPPPPPLSRPSDRPLSRLAPCVVVVLRNC